MQPKGIMVTIRTGGEELLINQDMKALSPTDDLLPEYLAYILRARTPSILREVEIARLIEKHTEKAISHCQPETSLILWRQASAIAM